jgi:transposase-like protein
MSDRVFSGSEKIRLTQLINEGMSVMVEIDTLQGGLTDTIKNIAEEMEIKPAILKKAIRTAFKATLGQTNQDHETLNTVLEAVGRVL